MKNEEFFCFSSLGFEDERKLDKTKLLIATKVKKGNQLVHSNLIALSLLHTRPEPTVTGRRER